MSSSVGSPLDCIRSVTRGLSAKMNGALCAGALLLVFQAGWLHPWMRTLGVTVYSEGI